VLLSAAACCADSAPPGNALIEQDGIHSGRLGLHQHFLFANLYQHAILKDWRAKGRSKKLIQRANNT
jgi:N-acetylglutamate synthase-like GNAT family acetyltransferase